MIRTVFIVIFVLLIATLVLCGIASWRSEKTIGRSVSLFCFSLIPPVLGNMIIVGATTENIASVGCYIYYVGMNLVMYTMINFTNEYCIKQNDMDKKTGIVPEWIKYLLVIDAVQLILNLAFKHAFVLQEIEAYGKPYFIMKALLGQIIHRVVCYGAMDMVMIVFIIRSIQASRLHRERYIVILFSMIIGTAWQTYYIFSQTPIDRSMIGFTVFGLLIFYFSIHYRPLRLLDSLLADIVNDTKVAVFLYDPEGKCIWINESAKKLTGIKGNDIDGAIKALRELIGETDNIPESQETEIIRQTSEGERSFMIARFSFFDGSGKNLGSYVRVRDITEEKQRIEAEIFAANHDELTGLYNKEYTYKKISDQLKQHALKDYYITRINVCDFKVFNDVFGKTFGDAALKHVLIGNKKITRI